jgi:hypothetical protein
VLQWRRQRALASLQGACIQVTRVLLQACAAAAVVDLPFAQRYACSTGCSYCGVKFKLLLLLVVTRYIQWWTCPWSRVTPLLVHDPATAHLCYSRCESLLLCSTCQHVM